MRYHRFFPIHDSAENGAEMTNELLIQIEAKLGEILIELKKITAVQPTSPSAPVEDEWYYLNPVDDVHVGDWFKLKSKPETAWKQVDKNSIFLADPAIEWVGMEFRRKINVTDGEA